MKRLSLQWRITLMTVLLIGAACVAMKLLICFSGVHYMDSIGAPFRATPSAASPPSLTPKRQDSGRMLPLWFTGRRRISA